MWLRCLNGSDCSIPPTKTSYLKLLRRECLTGLGNCIDTSCAGHGENTDGAANTDGAGGDGDDSPEATNKPRRRKKKPTRQATITSMTTKQRRLYKFYKFLSFAFNKMRTVVIYLTDLTWRFLELYLHKIIALMLFVTAISQVSVMYWILLVFVLVFMVPIPYINPLTFPILTFYLGLVTSLKMVYQLPIISPGRFFNFSQNATCMDIEVATPTINYCCCCCCCVVVVLLFSSLCDRSLVQERYLTTLTPPKGMMITG